MFYGIINVGKSDDRAK